MFFAVTGYNAQEGMGDNEIAEGEERREQKIPTAVVHIGQLPFPFPVSR